MNDIKLETEIVRNSEILQEHREEIENLKADVDMLINRDVVEPEQSKINVSDWQRVEMQKIIIDSARSRMDKLISENEKLKQLFERQIKLTDLAAKQDLIYGATKERFDEINEEYEELMEE